MTEKISDELVRELLINHLTQQTSLNEQVVVTFEKIQASLKIMNDSHKELNQRVVNTFMEVGKMIDVINTRIELMEVKVNGKIN